MRLNLPGPERIPGKVSESNGCQGTEPYSLPASHGEGRICIILRKRLVSLTPTFADFQSLQQPYSLPLGLLSVL